jgi:hypothetical protein
VYVVVIVTIVTVAIRLVSAFFDQIARERLIFPNFLAEWANLTKKITNFRPRKIPRASDQPSSCPTRDSSCGSSAASSTR